MVGDGENTALGKGFDRITRKNANKFGSMGPLFRVSEALREDVRRLTIRLLVEQDDVCPTTDLVEPVHRDLVSASKMTHGRVPTCLSDTNHGLVVFMDEENHLSGREGRPQVERR